MMEKAKAVESHEKDEMEMITFDGSPSNAALKHLIDVLDKEGFQVYEIGRTKSAIDGHFHTLMIEAMPKPRKMPH